MDTRSKKFNSTIVLKVIAFMLCLSCAVNCTTQIITSLYKASDSEIRDCSYEDALYEMFFKNRDFADTETFKYHVGRFAGTLGIMTGSYGDGSEKDYKQWKASISTSNDAFYKKARENIIKHVIADELRLYLSLVNDGVVVPLGMLEVTEYSGNSINIYEMDIEEYGESYSGLCNTSPSGVVKYTNDEELKKKAEKLGADGVFELKNYYQILEWHDITEEDIVIESYKPGYYAFKIDDTALKNKLADRDLFASDYYGSYEMFAKSYKRYADTLKNEYPSGKYYIRDASGRVYTNVKGLDAKSTSKQIEQSFASLGFYCEVREFGDIYLPDGDWFTQSRTLYFMNDEGQYEMATTAVPFDNVVADTTTMVEKVVDGEEVSVPVTVPVPTTSIDAFDETPFINEEPGKWVCMLGVDRTSDDFPATDLLFTSDVQIEEAEEILTDVLYTLGIMVTLFLICFIYLIARSGRRKGDREIHLMKADGMFTDWRIAIDGLLGFGVFMLGVWTFDEFAGEDREIFTKLMCLLVALFVIVLIDLVLFVTRQIKARRLFKNLFPVWLVRKTYGLCRSRVSAVRGFYKEKIRARIDEKLLYTKEFAKGTLVRIGIVVAANAAFAAVTLFEMHENYTCSFIIPWVLFDIGVLLWVIRLIGGLHKIFTALDEIKAGNYNVHISLFALPSTLRESAEKVMSLRDGLKTAVEEAVKQEQTKTELITNVSHDLKTPLTSIINYVELLKKCNITDDDAKEYLDVLGEKSDRLKKLIEDLVEASKASTGNIKVEMVEVSLNEMVSQLLGEHADGLENKKLSVIAEFPENELTVKADGKLLYRVMENLIVNVEKYSLYGTRVYVTVKNEGAYGAVTFKNISEQPLNISASELKERFVRGDESRSTEGNGLGLSIAQSLCDVQGGELEITINGDLFTAAVRLKK